MTDPLPRGTLDIDDPRNAKCTCMGIQHAEQFKLPWVEHSHNCPSLDEESGTDAS